MNSLVKELIKPFLLEDAFPLPAPPLTPDPELVKGSGQESSITKINFSENTSSKIIGLYGGGFKPPTKGHFNVVVQALAEYPELDELIILVGKGERDNITQAQSLLVWEIYQDFLPSKVKVEPVSSPIGDIKRFAKNHPDDTIYFILGARENNEDDLKDISLRTNDVKVKYPNMEVKVIKSSNTISGTKARSVLKTSKKVFFDYLPDVLNYTEKDEVYNILTPKPLDMDEGTCGYNTDVKTGEVFNTPGGLNENATYSDYIDYKQQIKNLTKYMIKSGMNIVPLPKIIFKHNDSNNAKNFLGKTAYYDPASKVIILYTEGRHPKDIVRSFSHEMIHHEQNLNNKLTNITTTNTNEDDNLSGLEKEAFLKGNMTFRNWTDTEKSRVKTPLSFKQINEKKNKDPFGLSAYALELARGLEEELIKDPSRYTIYCDMDGVLCDFDSQFEKYYNAHPRSLTNEELIKAIDAKGIEFWSEMEWMKGGKQIWSLISPYKPSLLTSPGKFKYAEEGKKIWVANNLTPQPSDIIFAQARNKHIILSGKSPEEISNSILVDDYYPNVAPWKEVGGIVAYNTPAGKAIRTLYALGFK